MAGLFFAGLFLAGPFFAGFLAAEVFLAVPFAASFLAGLCLAADFAAAAFFPAVCFAAVLLVADFLAAAFLAGVFGAPDRPLAVPDCGVDFRARALPAPAGCVTESSADRLLAVFLAAFCCLVAAADAPAARLLDVLLEPLEAAPRTAAA